MPQTESLDTHLTAFGLNSFRPGQKDVIQSVMDGHDCLCIMPTGGGKSLCYQLPAVAREGVTLVVSPLIALMKDQVDGLLELEIPATFINSSLTGSEQNARMEAMVRGDYQLVYIAPERLRSQRFSEVIRETHVQLLAIDEAHCISEWGHDFRPDYARLGMLRVRLGTPQTIALTATATPIVRQDVSDQLRLNDPKTFVTGFARPNLRMEVEQPTSGVDKTRMLCDLIRNAGGAGIVYASTRKGCEELVETLAEEMKLKVGLYHAGLSPDERRETQERFMRGEYQAIVATNAFGMGIDKSDLRFVVHFNMPGSLEAYYQEAGRAGRDGLPSTCTLLFSYADRYIQEFFIDATYPDKEYVRLVYDFIRRHPTDPVEMALQDIKDALNLPISAEGVSSCLKILEKNNGVARLDSRQNLASVQVDSNTPSLVELVSKDAKVQRKVMRKIEQIVDDRRYERVYFPPQRLFGDPDLEKDAVLRALRELRKLHVFDYAPPFRGRAVHVLDPDRPFHKLEIDFAELDRRKQIEYDKLERVLDYARTNRCRQWTILDYFGDPQREECHRCDNCGGVHSHDGGSGPVVDPAVNQALRIALSAVARSNGRFGKHAIAQMLCGSQSARMRKWKLDKLSTFGLYRELTQQDTIEILNILMQNQLVTQNDVDRHRPVLVLTPAGKQVMIGETSACVSLPPVLDMKLRVIGVRHLENERSKTGEPTVTASGNVTDEQDRPPASPAKVEDGISAQHLTSPDDDVPAAIEDVPASAPAHFWTWHLLSHGYSPEQCLQIRQLQRHEMLDHLLRASEEGHSIETDWFLDHGQLDLLARLSRSHSFDQLRPIVEAADGLLSYAEVQLYRRAVKDQ